MQRRKIAAKAIIISRVSTKRQQESGYSLTGQTSDSKEYCADNNLEILKIYELAESATTGKRKKFMEAITFAANQKEIIAVVACEVNILQSSNFKELEMLKKLIDDEKIELHFCRQNLVIHKYSTSQEKIQWDLGIKLVQARSNDVRNNVNNITGYKLHHGEWISLPLLLSVIYIVGIELKEAEIEYLLILIEHRL